MNCNNICEIGVKKIRIDYYHYRIRKGHADILLQKLDDKDFYTIPYHYVSRDERLNLYDLRKDVMEDDGDLVFLDCRLGDSHLKRDDKKWFPLNELSDIPLIQGRENHIIQYGLSVFLDICPSQETSIHSQVERILDDILTKDAKRKYVERLISVLAGEDIVMLDAWVSPPDPDLLKAEIETMAHFQLWKPEKDSSYRLMCYSYEPIHWETFGSSIHYYNCITKPDDLL